ncbi:hypothetical protein [Agromyces sp. CCNWLW203]|uniref:hypothetical protein n=1 Tax=Agromyces sp. CCNWLW203 TaxID=3112842 RepID=UPI002F964C75
MPESLIQYEGGEVLASLEDRTITGLLIPFNEIGRTNAGRFMVEAGAIDLPADPAVITLNLDHDRSQPVGRATRVWEEAAGVMATFAIANTPAGDDALADALNPKGKRRRLSGEFHAIIKAAKAVGGNLWGSALVGMGAFPSAMVLAADTPDEPTATSSSRYVTEYTDEAGDTWRRVEETTTTITETSTVVVEEDPDAEEDPEGETTVPVTATATVPVTQIGGAPVAVEVQARQTDVRDVYAALNTLRSDRQNPEALAVLAALNDVTTTTLSGGVAPAHWLGQINQGIGYTRMYLPLGTVGTDISIAGKKGFKIKRGTEAVPVDKIDGAWAGDKTAIKSGNGFVQTAQSTRRNWALGEDIGREFYDLEGGQEVVASFLELLVEDYHRWADESALADFVSVGGAAVAADTTKYPATYPKALGMLIQGMLALGKIKADGRRDLPTFAIANDAAFEELAYASGGEQNLPAFVSIAINSALNGEAGLDNKITIVRGDVGAPITAGKGAVIVGANYGVHFDEVPNGPLKIDALEIARGGIDRAFHGYLQTFKARPEAFVKISL